MTVLLLNFEPKIGKEISKGYSFFMWVVDSFILPKMSCPRRIYSAFQLCISLLGCNTVTTQKSSFFELQLGSNSSYNYL